LNYKSDSDKEVKKKQMSLLDNISKNGFNIREVSKSPLIYNVNDNTVNIKTKQTFKDKKLHSVRFLIKKLALLLFKR
jgi:hypothetical protein